MPAAVPPREVLERLVAGISAGRWDDLADLYAEDAVVEHPFALPEPTRIEGRDAIRRRFAGATQVPLELVARDIVVHETADPEVVIGEYAYDGRVITTGRTFTMMNILVMRIRDGQIAFSRDYHNHAALAEATGELPRPAAFRTGVNSS
jgi:ketosteroid isomerase-like protein